MALPCLPLSSCCISVIRERLSDVAISTKFQVFQVEMCKGTLFITLIAKRRNFDEKKKKLFKAKGSFYLNIVGLPQDDNTWKLFSEYDMNDEEL